MVHAVGYIFRIPIYDGNVTMVTMSRDLSQATNDSNVAFEL